MQSLQQPRKLMLIGIILASCFAAPGKLSYIAHVRINQPHFLTLLNFELIIFKNPSNSVLQFIFRNAVQRFKD